MTDKTPLWYALRVKPRQEKTTAFLLEQRGYESFLPSYRATRRWSDRIKQLELALFPGYLFCRFDRDHRSPILATPGVDHIVGVGRTPAAVADPEIAALQAIVASGVFAQPWPYLRVGETVRIGLGPLAGLEGLLAELKGAHRVVVSVSLLQRSVAVEVDAGWIC